jgi:hypothetical protein
MRPNVKNMLSKTAAIVVILGVPLFFFLGVVYGLLSPRTWAIGFLAWFVALPAWAFIRKRAGRNTPASTAEPAITIDDQARRRILREIGVRKAWIGILALLLAIGVVSGVTHRAWLPTVTGGGMNLLLMYLLAQRIKQRRDRLNSS